MLRWPLARPHSWFSSSPAFLTVLGDRLFFTTAIDVLRLGRELWVSDGTEAGTRLVQDIFPGAPSSAPANLTVGGDRLFFAADDRPHGRELWVLALAPATVESLVVNDGAAQRSRVTSLTV